LSDWSKVIALKGPFDVARGEDLSSQVGLRYFLKDSEVLISVGHSGSFKAGNRTTNRRLVGDSYPQEHVRLKKKIQRGM
jgi:hypothetical protein